MLNCGTRFRPYSEEFSIWCTAGLAQPIRPFFLQILEQLGLSFSLGDTWVTLLHSVIYLKFPQVQRYLAQGFACGLILMLVIFHPLFSSLFSVGIRKFSNFLTGHRILNLLCCGCVYVDWWGLLEKSEALVPSLIHVPLMCWSKRHLIGVESPQGGLYSGFQLILDPVLRVMWGLSTGKCLKKELWRKAPWRDPGGHQVDRVPATCPCGTGGQQHPALIR